MLDEKSSFINLKCNYCLFGELNSVEMKYKIQQLGFSVAKLTGVVAFAFITNCYFMIWKKNQKLSRKERYG